MRSLLNLVVVAALCAGGCVADSANNTSLVIIKNQPPDVGTCAIQGNDNGVYLGAGILDVSVSSSYIMTPLIQLRTEAFDPNDPLMRAVTLEGAEIDVDGVNIVQRFSVVVEPGASVGALFAITNADAVNGATTGTIFPEVKVFGKLSSSDIESNTFTFPVELCDGCLAVSAGTCDNFTAPCNPGQDDRSCCTDPTDGSLLCF